MAQGGGVSLYQPHVIADLFTQPARRRAATVAVGLRVGFLGPRQPVCVHFDGRIKLY